MTDGLGLFEYLVLCEELGATAQLSVYTGYSIGGIYPPVNESMEFIQDAADAVAFANGNLSSKYGAIRGKAGHPQSFNLTHFEVGNEEQGKYQRQYRLHFEPIAAVIRLAEPSATIIGMGAWGPAFPIEALVADNPCLNGDVCDLWDEHYYMTPDAMANLSHKYDTYNRSWPNVFAGEYAANVGTRPTLRSALAEALYMIGFENNADKVKQAAFAPLFNNINGTQWDYDMINFNASHVYGIPSHVVQRIFAENRPTWTVSATVTNGSLVTNVAAGVRADGAVIVKLVSYGSQGGTVRFAFDDHLNLDSVANVNMLAGSPDAENSFAEPTHVAPVVTQAHAAADGSFSLVLPPWSLAVLTLPTVSTQMLV